MFFIHKKAYYEFNKIIIPITINTILTKFTPAFSKPFFTILFLEIALETKHAITVNTKNRKKNND